MPRAARAAALFAAVALAAHAAAQPFTVTPTYTAFPDLKAPAKGDADWHPRLRAAAEAPLPPDSAPAARVRSAQLRSGLALLTCTLGFRNQVGRCFPSENELQELTRVVNDVYRWAAGGAADPAVRRELVEEWVRVLKLLERYTEARVPSIDPPQELDYIRFHRLGAEAELLRLRAG